MEAVTNKPKHMFITVIVKHKVSHMAPILAVEGHAVAWRAVDWFSASTIWAFLAGLAFLGLAHYLSTRHKATAKDSSAPAPASSTALFFTALGCLALSSGLHAAYMYRLPHGKTAGHRVRSAGTMLAIVSAVVLAAGQALQGLADSQGTGTDYNTASDLFVVGAAGFFVALALHAGTAGWESWARVHKPHQAAAPAS